MTSRNKNKRKNLPRHPLSHSILLLQVLLLFFFCLLATTIFPAVFRSEENSFLFILFCCCFLFAINSSLIFYFTTHSTMQNALLKDNTHIIFNKSSFSVPSFKYPFLFFFNVVVLHDFIVRLFFNCI